MGASIHSYLPLSRSFQVIRLQEFFYYVVYSIADVLKLKSYGQGMGRSKVFCDWIGVIIISWFNFSMQKSSEYCPFGIADDSTDPVNSFCSTLYNQWCYDLMHANRYEIKRDHKQISSTGVFKNAESWSSWDAPRISLKNSGNGEVCTKIWAEWLPAISVEQSLQNNHKYSFGQESLKKATCMSRKEDLSGGDYTDICIVYYKTVFTADAQNDFANPETTSKNKKAKRRCKICKNPSTQIIISFHFFHFTRRSKLNNTQFQVQTHFGNTRNIRCPGKSSCVSISLSEKTDVFLLFIPNFATEALLFPPSLPDRTEMGWSTSPSH